MLLFAMRQDLQTGEDLLTLDVESDQGTWGQTLDLDSSHAQDGWICGENGWQSHSPKDHTSTRSSIEQ